MFFYAFSKNKRKTNCLFQDMLKIKRFMLFLFYFSPLLFFRITIRLPHWIMLVMIMTRQCQCHITRSKSLPRTTGVINATQINLEHILGTFNDIDNNYDAAATADDDHYDAEEYCCNIGCM